MCINHGWQYAYCRSWAAKLCFFPQYLCMEKLNIHNRREKKSKKVNCKGKKARK